MSTTSITSFIDEIVAFLVALFIGVFFLIIFDVLSNSFTGSIAYFFNSLSLSTHYESVSRGVIDSKDLIYFLSITVTGLLLADTVLSKRNIVE